MLDVIKKETNGKDKKDNNIDAKEVKKVLDVINKDTYKCGEQKDNIRKKLRKC